MVASVPAMLNLLKGLWFDGELYKFHCQFHMIYILIMQLRGASFILWMKSKVLLCSEWSWFPFVYMGSFLYSMPAAVGDLVQQKLSYLKNITHLS